MSSKDPKPNSNVKEDVVKETLVGTGNSGTSTGNGGSEKDAKLQPLAAFFGVMVYVVVGLIIAWQFPTARELIIKWRLGIAVFVVVVFAVSFFKPIREGLAKTTPKGRIGLVLFGVIPVLLVLFGMVVLLPERYQVAALRVIFLVPVCFLPAIMYYLFMATKKNSLFNEFIMNLDRLGLLDLEPGEREAERENRVLAYQQRFEAVYGAAPTDLADLVLVPVAEGRISRERRSKTGTGSGTISDIFSGETAVPVVLSTVLIALGWLITLPPWETADLTTKPDMPAKQEGPAKAHRAEQSTDKLLASLIPQESIGPLAMIQAEDQPADPSAAQTEPQQAEAQPQSQPATKEPRAMSQKWLAAFNPESTPVHFAFLGAYFFCLQMLFRRYVRRDLRASAYVSVALRIILAVIGTWVVVAAAAALPAGWLPNRDSAEYSSRLLVLGFVIGVFPRVAWQIIQSLTKRAFGLAVDSLKTQLPVNDLDGLTVWHEARLEEEDIENIPNMATADIVDLMLNTRFPPDRIIDWVDQAILYTHLGPEESKAGVIPRRDVLRVHCIRTASGLVEAYNRSSNHDDLDKFEKILPSADGARSPMRSLVDELGTIPNLELIQTWRRLEPHTHVETATAD
jgi:hypothetical protein